MASKYFCDICKKEAKETVRVGWKSMYCTECWRDKKCWPRIHKLKTEDI